jgi:hypothetical protein
MKNLDFRNYTNNSSDHFNAVSFRNDVLLRQRYESLFTEGIFYAVCLSSFKDEENTGESEKLGSSSNVSQELEITVKPISQQEFNNALQGNFNVVVEGAPAIGDSLPPLVGLTDPNDIMRKLDLYHSAQYLKAKSRLSDKAGNLSLSFGEIVECYYEFGSIIEGTAQGLRFKKLEQSSIHEGYTQLLSVAPLISSLNSFKAGATSFLGDLSGGDLYARPATPSERLSQEEKLISLDPRMRPKIENVLIKLKNQNFRPKVYFAWRSLVEQKDIVEKGNSKVYFSFHTALKSGRPNAYAVDIIDKRWAWTDAAAANGFWEALGKAGKEEGLYWGGDWESFPDWAHLQFFPNNKLRTVLIESGLPSDFKIRV